MNKEKMMQIAEHNLDKAQRALNVNCNRKGITELERQNLSDSVEYAKAVCDLIANNM